MKKSYLIKFLTLGIFLSFTFSFNAQTKKELKKIKGKYDLQKLDYLKKEFNQKATAEKAKALQLAKLNNWPTIIKKDGKYAEIQKIINGKPIYYTTFNIDAAKSTRTNHLNNGGSLGLNLNGQNMTAYVWDGGIARASHQEYDGAGGSNRFSVGDGSSTLNFHAAHVTGTIIASGVQANAKGMAPHASAIGNDWNNDLAEATTAAGNGMLVSNHSYGFSARNPNTGQAWLPDYYFGGYIEESRGWDNLMFNAPNYLMVVAAGNDGNDNSANGAPLNGNSSYDKLTGHSTSKNNLVVANAQDANIDANGNLISVTINSSSSEGPTDDLRIKPDITGNGTGVYSTYHNSDSAYNSISGTSMASPNVAGTLLLLQQHANSVNGSYMRAATLKGLALHTADDAGTNGPDAIFGWGLLNAKKAAEAITQNGNESKIEELTLTSGQTYQITVDSDGVNNLIASISWTDRPGTANTIVNNSNAVLVNDLDVRVTKGATTHNPWRLTGITTNGKGDNIVDPFERVDVPEASGTYTITVTHKGSLTGGSQNFSLIVTGLSGTPIVCNATVPTGVSTTNVSASGATIGWDTVTAATYDVRYRVSGTSTWITNTVNGTSTVLSGLSANTSYEVQVRSKCSSGNSAYSTSANFTTPEVQLNYCASNGNDVSDEYISRVQIETINNTSGASSSGYADYSSISTNLTKGNSSTITITPTWTGTIYNEGYAVFIDYNKDGDFDDSGETVWTQSASKTTPVTGSFTIPTSSITGQTRMRVVMQYNAVPSACGSYNYGETEDYTVNIVSGAADATAPVITLNGASTINLTVGDSFTDPGATATDNVDGNISANIVVTGSVNTSVAGTYTLNYNVSDAAGNAATQVSRTVNVNEPAGDTQAPTAPTNLTASNITETTASLSWTASSDNVGVTEYEVFSSGTSIGTVTSTGANITGLVANTTYSYTVTSKDAAGNVSSASNTATFTTLGGTGSGSTTTIHEGFFESGWDGWTDGGSDCYRYSGSRSYEGNYSIRLRDNSGTASAMTSESFNLTSYDQVEIKFYFYSYSMENGEDFWLRFYNGSSWATVGTWARGTSFDNNNFYTATVTLNASEHNFATNSRFRFQNDASANADHIYIDQVTIKGIIGNGGNSINTINTVGNNFNSVTSISNNSFNDSVVYPNPAVNVLNINPSFGAIKSTFRITNLLGQVIKTGTIKNNSINISTLKKGIYLIELTDEEETFTQKFIKQ